MDAPPRCGPVPTERTLSLNMSCAVPMPSQVRRNRLYLHEAYDPFERVSYSQPPRRLAAHKRWRLSDSIWQPRKTTGNSGDYHPRGSHTAPDWPLHSGPGPTDSDGAACLSGDYYETAEALSARFHIDWPVALQARGITHS